MLNLTIALYADTKLMEVKGIVIVDSIDAVNPNWVNEFGFHYRGPKFLKSNEVAAVVTPFIGTTLTTNSLHTLQRNLILLCRDHDHPVIDVFFPEQVVETGVAQIAILEGKAGKVVVKRLAGKWFSDRFITNKIRLKPGDPIKESRLLADINWLNQNPAFRNVQIAFSQGDVGGATDIHLTEEDHFPLQGTVGYDNEGPKIIGEDRVSAGALWGKAFGLDEQLKYVYTTDTSFYHLREHTANYDIPLPWRNTLAFFGSYADVRAEDLPGALGEKGSSYQISTRYIIPLPNLGKYTHELSLGFDFKHSDNNLLFGGTVLAESQTPTEVDQFAGSYRALLPDDWGESDLAVEAYYSPGNLTSENNRADFSRANPADTASEYYYVRFNADRSITNHHLLGQYSMLMFKAQAQETDCKLVPSEEMGFGGMTTVRGYDERWVNADRGFVVNSEIHRLIPLGSLFYSKPEDTIDLLAFCDYGLADVIHPSATASPTHFDLASVGAGANYLLRKNVELKIYYGFQLIRNELGANYLIHNNIPSDHSASRGHIELLVRF